MTRSQTLRFSSENELLAHQQRRERFKSGTLHLPERDVLASVLEFCRLDPRVAWAKRMNAGVTKYKDAAGVERWVRFGFAGLSDVIGQLQRRAGERVGAFLAIECKSDTGRVEPEQAAFIETVRSLGGCAGVARNATDAKSIIDEFWQQ